MESLIGDIEYEIFTRITNEPVRELLNRWMGGRDE
jgi:hypothetical protein